MITDYHVHLETGPYTIDWVQQYLSMAKERGITDLGFSEHGYRFKQAESILFNPWIEKHQTEDIEQYINLVLDAKKMGLPVKLGLELDYVLGKENEIEAFLDQYPWDYVIGSVHWIEHWGFDIMEMKDKWDLRETIDIYLDYFKRIDHLIKSNLFDILGHIDVIKVFGHKPSEEQEKLFDIYQNLIKSIKKNNLTVEVNTAGLRKPVKEIYPEPRLMQLLAKNNVPLIINSDAHQPKDVGANYDFGINYLKSYGIDKISIFNNRERTIVPLG